MRVAIVRFPGSNCDADTLRAAQRAGGDAYYVWHRDQTLNNAEVVVLPGGFAYGDYLRAGAIARFSEIMNAVCDHARQGGPVLGICNGFQVLCEAGLLPGALVRNAGVTFVSRPVTIRVEATDTPFTRSYDRNTVLAMPIAHGEGRYVASSDVLRELAEGNRIVFRYHDRNPNGSLQDIAGITNEERNVVGMMPHPERAADRLLGGTDGALIFDSMVQAAELFGGGTR